MAGRSLRPLTGVAALALLLPLAGCSINPALTVSGTVPAGGIDLTRRVPFHPQTEYQCGPAALATVLGASGVATSPKALAPQVYLPGRQGSLQLELVGATRRAGRIPYLVDRDPQAVFDELAAGRPVLVLQNLLAPSMPRWHYAVAVGVDPDRERILLNSGERRGLSVRARTFLRTWDWGERWGLVALRPGELPENPDATRYLAAVADFEAVSGADAARPAYLAALERWPADARVHLALGNQAHSAGDVPAATGHYRDGWTLSPGDPVLGNNYASTLGALGCRSEALQVLDEIGDGAGRWREALAGTRAGIVAGEHPADRAVCDRFAPPAR